MPTTSTRPPKRLLVDLTWTSVSVCVWEPEGQASETVLLLHGGGYDSAELSWGLLGPALADAGYRVLAPDVPGCGQSPAADWEPTQERLVAWVAEVVEALGLRAFVLGGLSMGGGMALGYALRRPDGIRSLLLFGSYGLADRILDGPGSALGQLASWALVRAGLMGPGMRWVVRHPALVRMTERNLLMNADQRTPELTAAIMAEGARGSGVAHFERWQVDQTLPDRLRTSYVGQLHQITEPVLLIHGSRDVGVPVDVVREAARRFPDARCAVIVGAGHWVQRDRPELVTPLVVDFLGGVAGR